MKSNLLLLVCSIVISHGFAQVNDNFNDGDFSNNPNWTGDSVQFLANNFELQLSSTGSDSSYLSTPYAISGIDGYEWDFKIHENFSPSSQNYGRVYLLSDQQNLKGPLNGYFLQFGESGNADAIELFSQNGYTLISIARGSSGSIASSFEVSVKIYRDSSGVWNIYTDYSGGTNYQFEASGTNTQFQQGVCIGVKCVYTSSNANKFYFDNFYAGPLIRDTTPPIFLSAIATSNNTADVIFDEKILLNGSSFTLDNGIGNPSIITQDPFDSSMVHLTFPSNFNNALTYTLTSNHIYDRSGNILYSATQQFKYIAFGIVQPGDVIISEIMPDPTGSPGLPEAEYVEIYNASMNYFNTAGWHISDGSTLGVLPTDTLAPGEYRVYANSTNAQLLLQHSIPNVRGLSAFPGLNNDGDHLRLTDQYNELLDELIYTPLLFQDALKQDGGWSLERIDINFHCPNSLNWKASMDISGGSPGISNSVQEVFIDMEAPQLVYISTEDSLSLLLHFSENPDLTDAYNTNNYSISNGIGLPQSAEILEENHTIIRLSLSTPIRGKTVYEVTVSDGFRDCAGNKIGQFNTSKCGLAETLSIGDIILNEILFNADPEGADFVEIRNVSEKNIDLSDLKIANADPVTGTIETVYPVMNESRVLFPGEYFVFTDGSSFIKSKYNPGDPRNILNCNLPSFTDDEGIVVLMNTSLIEQDRFHYKASYHFPLLNDVEGVSLEKVNASRPSSDSTNWHSAAETAGFATPGVKNSQSQEGISNNETLTIEPELFSPDNDGEKDIVNLSLKTGKPGFYTSITIYNSEGEIVCRPVINELSGTESGWSWDGLTSEKNLAPIGIYIVYVELIHPSGEVIHLRKPCVLAHRL